MGKILVVDDEAKVSELVQKALEIKGHTVLTTSIPLKALDLIEKEPIDLVITDLKMPGMDGFDLAEKIKQTKPNIGIILMTGYWRENMKEIEGNKPLFYDYLIKPFQLKDLQERVAAFFNEKKKQEPE